MLDITWGECLVPAVTPPPEMRAHVRHAFGTVPGWLVRIAPCPWLVRAFTRFLVMPWAYAPPELWELVGLVVSQDNSCRYCFGVQRAILKVLGYDDDRVARLERDFHVAELSPGQRAALDFARKLSRADPRPRRADYDELTRHGLEEAVIAEIVFGVAASAFTNRVATLLALPVESEFEALVRRPIFKLIRPLMAWRMRPRPRPPIRLTRNEGIGAAVVAALGTSPSAQAVRDVLDDAWSSPILPARTKTLVLLVIAKALGCARMEGDARSLLRADGFDDATLNEVLANLASSRLDRREALLVPFARETVRYQPADIQRRMAEVTRDMTPTERIELAGIIALANAVCRLSVLLDVC